MPQKTYLFYDLETSGLNPCFDQVMQFAAIRTDVNFNELERVQFFVRLSPSTIPAPMAMLTHQISLKDCEQGLSELEAIQKIYALLNQPGTISLGYNTLQFDDEFLRFSFYRHLLPPYTHQYANDCGRMDLYPITMMFSVFKEEALVWKEMDGRRSLKLEVLNQYNNLAPGAAHDAMVDVEVTLALARRLFHYPDMWNYLLSYFDKREDQERLLKLPVWCSTPYGLHYEAFMAESVVGSRADYCAPVICLGTHRHYKNQTLWLRLDLPELQKTTRETIKDNTWVMRKRFGEPGFLLPPLPRYWDRLDAERLALVQSNKAWLLQSGLLESIAQYHQDVKYPNYPNTDAAALLYANPFPTSPEQAFYAQFLKSTPNKQAELLDRFAQPVIRELAARLLAREHLDLLPPIFRDDYEKYLRAVWTAESVSSLVDFKGRSRLTVGQVMAEMAQIRAEKPLDERQVAVMRDLEEYLVGAG